MVKSSLAAAVRMGLRVGLLIWEFALSTQEFGLRILADFPAGHGI
jgi:hypothetical protein